MKIKRRCRRPQRLCDDCNKDITRRHGKAKYCRPCAAARRLNQTNTVYKKYKVYYRILNSWNKIKINLAKLKKTHPVKFKEACEHIKKEIKELK